MLSLIKINKRFSAGVFFLLCYAFGTMFLMFFGHAVMADMVNEQQKEIEELLELAKDTHFDEKIFQYEKSLMWIKNAQQKEIEPLHLGDSVYVGIFGGLIFSTLTYCVYLYTEKVSKSRHPHIWNPTILLTSFITVLLFFAVFYGMSSWKHPHLATSVFDYAVGIYFTFPIPIMISLHIILQKRIKIFEKKSVPSDNLNISEKGEWKNYRASVDMEHKTWIQILQSSVFGLLFIIGGVMLTVLSDSQDLKEMSSLQGGFNIMMYQVILLALWFFAGFFGVLLRILRYLGDLSEFLL